MKYNTNLGGYLVDIDQSQLEDAPSYAVGTEPAWGDPDYERTLHDYYGVTPRGGPAGPSDAFTSSAPLGTQA